MSFIDRPFTFDRVARIGITVLLIYGTIWLLDYLSEVLVPFAIAFLLAYIMKPFVDFLQRFVKKRVVAVLLSLFISLILFVGLILLLIPMITNELKHMGELISELINQQGISNDSLQYLPQEIWEGVQEFIRRKEVQEFFNSEKFKEVSLEAAKNILPGLVGVFSGAISIVIGILGLAIILLYLIFLLLDYDTIVKEWYSLIPMRYKETVLEVITDFEKAMSNYFRAQALVAFLVGVLFSIGFLIIGLPLAIVLGLFVGLLNMVPYLQTVGLIPAAFLAAIHSMETGTNFWIVLGFVVLVFAVVQTIQDGFLVPKIMGDATGLNPAAILLSLSIWGKLLGILGLIIALPITYLLLSYYRKFVLPSFRKQPVKNDNTAGFKPVNDKK